eukprot:CAMPEP_0203650816 /NCGR_PEP_ID=MMETSP0088-20131115/25704_1 /ASSEMBLY_ACC=CAM_ASM_001087 /TAXON_ID=426623 /ORGANISM="Chaetoceros affinis, Strain CCMP159" /LENGTH=212 /DNA_ID=CAMNT_0050509723 /DNA_START=64 /DNA_END=699 /DNA_ORIENTATION=+
MMNNIQQQQQGEEQPCWADPNAAAVATTTNMTFQSGEIQGTIDGGAIGGGEGDGNFLAEPYSTLDEPVRETIMRDVRSVSSKIQVILLPLKKTNPLEYVSVSTEEEVQQDENQRKVLQALRDWDLWGPLVVCLALSILLSIRSPTEQASGVFAAVFCSMWLGSAIVTVNAKLLGGTISFFQSVCVLGYSVFPFVISALLIAILSKSFLGHVW